MVQRRSTLDRSLRHTFSWGRALLFLVVAVCLAQIAWWIYFQVEDSKADLLQSRKMERLVRDRVAAEWRADPPQDRAEALRGMEGHPTLQCVEWSESDPDADPGARVETRSGESLLLRVSPEHWEELSERARSRRLMATTEGGFLALVALLGVVAIYWLMHREVRRHRQQSELLAAITHDFRSPLTAIRLLVQTFEKGRVPEAERDRWRRSLFSNLERLEDLVQNVLTAARLREGKLTLHPEPVDLADEVGRYLDQRSLYLEHHQVEVEKQLQPGVETAVDRKLFLSVFGNLLENAVKFSDPPARISVRVTKRNGSAELSIEDRGAGFEPSESDELFERFTRGRAEANESRPGVGLGLYLVREIVALSGGEVEAHSEGPGSGACFTVRLPAREGGR